MLGVKIPRSIGYKGVDYCSHSHVNFVSLAIWRVSLILEGGHLAKGVMLCMELGLGTYICGWTDWGAKTGTECMLCIEQYRTGHIRHIIR